MIFSPNGYRIFKNPYRNDFAILLIAASFYLFQIDSQVPWNDEVFSIIDAQNLKGLNLLIRPIFYFLLHIWLYFSDSLIWLRSLSAAFSVLSVVMIYRLAKRLFGEPVGLVSACCLLLSVIARHHAHEIRMYSMGTFFILAGTYFFVGALRGEVQRNLNWWAILRLASFLTIPLSATILSSDIFILLSNWKKDPSLVRSGILKIGVILFLWSPSFYFMNREKNRFFSDWVADRSRPSVSSAVDLVTHNFTFGALPSVGAWIFWGTGMTILSLMFFPLSRYSFLSLKKRFSEGPGWLGVLCWTFFPFLILVTYSCFVGNLWVLRYFLFLQPFFIILLAKGLVELWGENRPFALLTGGIYLSLCVFNLFHPELTRDHSQASYRITQEISVKEKNDDVFFLLASDPARYADLLRYFYHGNLVIDAPEKLGRNGDHWSLDSAELNSRMSSLFESKKRIWFVFRPTGLDHTSGVSLSSILKNDFIIKDRKDFYLMSLYLLEPRSGAFIKI